MLPRAALCPQAFTAPTQRAGPGSHSLRTQVQGLPGPGQNADDPIGEIQLEKQEQPARDGQNTLPEGRQKPARGNVYPCPQQPGLLRILSPCLPPRRQSAGRLKARWQESAPRHHRDQGSLRTQLVPHPCCGSCQSGVQGFSPGPKSTPGAGLTPMHHTGTRS